MSKYIKEKLTVDDNKRDLGFALYSVAVLAYLLAINNTMTSALSIIAVIAIVPFFFYPERFLPLLFACAINGEFFVAFQGISMARIYTLVFIVGMIVRMIIKKIKFNIRDIIINALLVLFVVISCGTSYSGELTPAFSFGLYIAMLLMLLYVNYDRKYFVFGCTLISLVLSVFYLVALVSGSETAIMGRGSINDEVNINQLAMGIAQLAAFNFSGYFVAEKKILKFLLALSCIFNTISLIYTGSRSSVIGAVVGVIACILLMTFGKSHEVRGLRISTLIIIAIGFAAVSAAVVGVAPDVLDRFTVDNVKESGGTGRIDVWLLIINDVFPAFPFFGLGYGGQNLSFYLRDNFGLSHGAHNFFFDILSSMGIVGILIFIPYLIFCLIKAVKTFKFDCSSLIPFTMLITIVFNGVGENTLGTRIFWFAAGLCLMISRQKRENNPAFKQKRLAERLRERRLIKYEKS